MTRLGTALVVALVFPLGVGCGTAIDSTTSSEPESSGSPTATETTVVIPHPQVDWDAPVVRGIEATEETAQEVAQASFDIQVPQLPGTLLKIQATDPAEYPEDFRGYGILYDIPTDEGLVRLVVEEMMSGPGESELVRNMAQNGDGFELGIVEGVEVVFIHPTERASAIFIYDGLKYNVNGPDIPLWLVQEVVGVIIGSD